MNRSLPPSPISRALALCDLYLVDYAPFSVWIGLAVGQIMSPLIAKFYLVSAALVQASIILGFATIGGWLLIRMLRLSRPASLPYLRTLTMMLPLGEREEFEKRLSWLLTCARPICRADALNAYRGVKCDSRRARASVRAMALSDAQRAFLGREKARRA